ncbi:MAG: ABC transporter permease [Rhodospirillales bacterium]|nr:ABC transporter permease [Rhodospirillales bacterium]
MSARSRWNERAAVTDSWGITLRRVANINITPAVRDRLISILSPFVLLASWEACAVGGLLDTRFFPAPSTVFSTLVKLIETGVLWDNTWASMTRLFWGFLLGAIPALAVGIAMGLYRPLRAAIDPLIALTYPIPKSAILPLLLLIFGLGEASKIVMVAIGVFYPICINAVAGVLEINKIYLDVGKNFQASRWNVFRTIALPGALPFIMSGVKLGIGMGLILIVLAEMVGAKSGLGYMIWHAWEILAVEMMYIGLMTVAVIGYALSVLSNELERWILPWKVDR